MRARIYEELRETGEQKKRAFRENIYQTGHLRFEEHLSWDHLDVLCVCCAVIRFVFDIYTQIQKIQCAELFSELSILQDTKIKIDNHGEM